MMVVFYSYIAKSSHSKLLNYLSFFSDEFQEKVLKYRKWEDAQLSLLGRLLLKTGLENYLNSHYDDTEIEYMIHAKPYFKSKKYHFNISHSGNIAICAISENNNIGIDIEIIKDIDIEHFRGQMTNFEWNKITRKNLMDINMFYDYWTEKEAVIKASGKGLSIPLKSFEVKNNRAIIDGEKYMIKKLKIDDNYKCNIAFEENNKFLLEYNDTLRLIHLEF